MRAREEAKTHVGITDQQRKVTIRRPSNRLVDDREEVAYLSSDAWQRNLVEILFHNPTENAAEWHAVHYPENLREHLAAWRGPGI